MLDTTKVVVNFGTDIYTPTAKTAAMLGDSVVDSLKEYAPSTACAKAGNSPVLTIEIDDEFKEHWTPELEDTVREALEYNQRSTGNGTVLEVSYIP